MKNERILVSKQLSIGCEDTHLAIWPGVHVQDACVQTTLFDVTSNLFKKCKLLQL